MHFILFFDKFDAFILSYEFSHMSCFFFITKNYY